MDKALEALHVAAKAIAKMDGVTNCTVDNDHKSGEILFEVDGQEFALKLMVG